MKFTIIALLGVAASAINLSAQDPSKTELARKKERCMAAGGTYFATMQEYCYGPNSELIDYAQISFPEGDMYRDCPMGERWDSWNEKCVTDYNIYTA